MLYSFISLLGAVALLLWGTYMVKTGILRTFGDRLREYLAQRLTGRIGGFFAGAGLALLLQSSTASALLIAGLQGKGLVTTLVALAAVLGADLGSAIVVRVLSFDLSVLIPILTFLGTALFLSHPDRHWGQFGRIFLGLAFILSAIAAIHTASAPLRGEEASAMLALLSQNGLVCALAGCVLALLCFSSLAAVMITAGAVAAGGLGLQAACWCVLGANLGSAALAIITSWNSTVVVKRAPFGNCIFRSVGFLIGAIALWLCPVIPEFFPKGPEGAVYFHLTFNAIVGVFGLLFLKPVSHVIDLLLPDRKVWSNASVRILGDEDMITPEIVLKELTEETVKSAHFLVVAWNASAQSLAQNLPAGVVLEMKQRYESVVQRCNSVRVYLDLLVRRGLSVKDLDQWKRIDEANDVLKLVSNVAAAMAENLGKSKCDPGRYFSHEGLTELETTHQRVADQLKRFENFLQSAGEDSDKIAQEMIEAQSRDAAENFALIAHHMQRVAQGRVHSVETSTLHVDLLSGFRRIEGILALTAVNIPKSTGLTSESQRARESEQRRRVQASKTE